LVILSTEREKEISPTATNEASSIFREISFVFSAGITASLAMGGSKCGWTLLSRLADSFW